MRTTSEAVDIREFALALRREWRWVAGGVIVGLLLAVLVLLFVRPRYQASATVLLRTQITHPGSLMSSSGGGEGEGTSVSLGGLAEMFSMDTGFETEMEILGSRAVVGAVVDSLGLQARVLKPWGTPLRDIIASAHIPTDLETIELEFERTANGYRVEGEGVRATARPGEPFEVAGARLTLRPELPDEFTLELTSRQDAVKRTLAALNVERAGGNVAELTYRDVDPHTAAAVPNAIIDKYMLRRTTTDRSTNRRRYEFLRSHTDSIATQLQLASEELRRHQEQSGLLSPEVRTEAEVEQAMALKSRRQELEIDARALAQILALGEQGTLDAHAVASYPTLIQNAAVNQLLARLSDLEAQRTELLDRRTPEDPDVQLVELEIGQTQQRIVEIARSFQAGVARQIAEVDRELARSQAQLAALPEAVERSLQLEREVDRLSETLVALQTQLVQARLAAIAEGGDLMQIDTAEPPRRPLYPRAPITLALGLFGGLFFGVVSAIGNGSLGRRVHDPLQIERLTGIPAVLLRHDAPLLLRDVDTARSILVVAADRESRALPAARRLAATGALRGRTVVLADLEDVHHLPTGEMASAAADAARDAAEADAEVDGGLSRVPGSEALGGEASPRKAPPGKGLAARAGADASGVPTSSHEPTPEPQGGGYQLFRPNGNLRMGARPLLDRLEERGSLVVAALPPPDQAVTAALVESGRSVAVVVRAGKTTRASLEEVLQALARMDVDVSGVILDRGKGLRG